MHPQLLEKADAIERIRITIYEPAFSIIGDSHKRDPRTRQSADHSMVYIVATLLRKAIESAAGGRWPRDATAMWHELILLPTDYSDTAIMHPLTRQLMERIDFRHGGADFDSKYPDGIPTSIEIDHAALGTVSSGLVMYPEGHARNTSGNLDQLLTEKFVKLAGLGVHDSAALLKRVAHMSAKSAREIADLYCFEIKACS